MSLLTTNQLVFSVDSRSDTPMVTRLATNIMLFRLSVSYDKNAENWGLVIQSAQERDSASYLCQVRGLTPGQEGMLLLIGKHLV